MKTATYSIYNQGETRELAKLGMGRRTVIALPPGRVWITIINWATLDVAHLRILQWESLLPKAVETDKVVMLRAMKERLRYVQPTKDIIEALRFAGGRGKDLIMPEHVDKEKHLEQIKKILAVADFNRLKILAQLNDVLVKEKDNAGLLKMRIMNAFKSKLAKGEAIKET